MAEAKIDIKKLSFEELENLRNQVNEVFSEKEKAEKNKAIAEIAEKIKKHNITAEELGFHVTTVTKSKTKPTTTAKVVAYKNEKGETWSGGRGPKPQWVKDVISKDGINALEKYKVS